MTICILGDLEELSATYIKFLAEKRDVDVLYLAESMMGIDWSLQFDDQYIHSAKININDRSINASEIDGVYVRFNPSPELPMEIDLTDDQKIVFVSERRHALQYFLNTVPVNVINRPKSGRSNGSKPYQMGLLEDIGFKVPRWIVTNQVGTAKEFAHKFSDRVIYKSISGLRSRVRFYSEELLERLANGTVPVLLQEYIEGSDARVHIVGDKYFGANIDCSGIDYRFDTKDVDYKELAVPDHIAQKCIQFARKDSLTMTGVDFKITNDNWYCLEANPVPSFLPYEMCAGNRIGESVVDYLLSS